MMRRTTTIIFPAIALLLVMAGCSVHKNTARSRFWQSFTARYNTYYNGHQAYIDGSLEKEQGNKDNFTEPLPLFTVGNKASRDLGRGNFERTVEKMEKTIKQHSIKAKPEWKKSRRKTARDREWLGRREYNPFLWKAWLMLGQAQFQQGNFDEAAATFSYMGRLYQTQPAQYALARAWLARSYTQLGWMYEAEDVIRNMSRDSIHYTARNTWNETLADFYLQSGNLEQAVNLLRGVIRHEPRRTQKAREWFIMGQVLTTLGRQQEAYKAYSHVIRQNPPYELEFNARIAQTEVMAQGNARKMISRLRRMAASENNKDYLDQVYYAIGNIYMMQADTLHAIGAYEQGNEKATRSGIEKGVLLLRLGDLYWQLERYNDAQRCYGEAIGLLDKDRPDYEELSSRSRVLDELVPYTDAIHLQDSLQQLAVMPEAERLAAIDRVIEALLKKEKEERDRAREAEVEQAQQQQGAQGNRNQRNNNQQNQNTADGQWYFYNQMAVNQGKQTFQQQWGRRDNTDNWQRINQTVVASASDAFNDAEALDGPDTEAPDSLATTVGGDSPAAIGSDSLALDPHNREYYLAQIPFTDEQRAESDAIIQDALYHAGVIFKDKLDNLTLSQKQLERLTTQYPDYEQNDQAWYHLYLLFSRRGDSTRAANCLARMQADYPESDWTTLLSDPYFVENARFGVHIEDSLYAATYDAFRADRHDVIAANAQLSADRFPLGANRPKFLFIYGLSLLNQGDAQGCIEKLGAVVEQYPQSEVSEMAGMIVKGVQEGRTLYGGKFDLDNVWSRRDLTLATDSARTDTLSADVGVPFVFMLAYQPDSITGENQLLFEMARFNFTNFLVRNFDLEIERMEGYSRMMVRGFLNHDEAVLYARQLLAAPELHDVLQGTRSLIISEPNLALLGSRYSYQDYDEFYERTFMSLPISNEELLQEPEDLEILDPEDIIDDDEPADEDDGDTPATAPAGNNGYDFDEDFW